MVGLLSWVQADMQERVERTDSHADQRQDQQPHMETMELVTLMEKYPNVILTLLVRYWNNNQLSHIILMCFTFQYSRTMCL